MKPIRVKKPIQDVAQPATKPWDRYQFIDDAEKRRLTWEKVCEEKELEAHRERVAKLTELYYACRAHGDSYAWKALKKLDDLRKIELRRGWVKLPWEVSHAF